MSRFIAFLALALLAAPAAAQSVGTDIVLVRVAGPWQTAGDRGFSRLVGKAESGRLAVALEWISESGAIVQTMPLPVPPGAEDLALARVRGENGPADSAVYFITPGGETFVLIVGAPGDARLGPATN